MVYFNFMLDFGIVPTVWFILILCRFWNCSDSVVYFNFMLDLGIVPTVWFILILC